MNTIKARVNKLENISRAEKPEIKMNWDDLPEGANPEPGELWIIWETDGSITEKRGNPDGTVTINTNVGADIP